MGSSPVIGFDLKYGWVPEWPKGADCKSVVTDFGGSNPPSPTIDRYLKRVPIFVAKPRKMALLLGFPALGQMRTGYTKIVAGYQMGDLNGGFIPPIGGTVFDLFHDVFRMRFWGISH